MTKKHSTKRALIASILSLMLCFTMLIGTTFAWFTDTVVSGSNVIQSGNLDIVLEYWDGTQWLDAEGKVLKFLKADGSDDEVLWEPGCTYQLPKVRFRNEGSLAAYSVIRLNDIEGDMKLMEVLDFTTTINNIPQTVLDGSQGSIYGPFEDATYGVMFGEKDGNIMFDWTVMGKGVVSPNSGHTDTSPEFTLTVHMAETAGNEYQDLTLSGVSIAVLAVQSVYEYDSFGREYDSDAKPNLPALDAGKHAGGDTLSAGGVSVTLPDSAEEANYTLNVDNKRKETVDGLTTLSLNIDLRKDGEKVGNGEYTVSIALGKNAIISGVTHNGNAVEDYSFDASTKILTFTTDSFSPFAVTYSTATYNVSTADELIKVLEDIKTSAKQQIPGEAGNKKYRENAIIVLENDIVIDSSDAFMYTDSNGAPLHFYGVKGILDLNGHSITATENALLSGKGYANALLLFQYSDVDIVGEGSLITENKSIPVYGWANSTVNIYGGNYVTNAPERNESAVYVNNASVMINVYGGDYTNCAYAFNVHDNCKNTTTIVLHEGIEFNTFLKNGTTDVTASDLNNGRIAVAEGCEIVKTDARNVVTKAK